MAHPHTSPKSSDVKEDFWNALARSPFLMVKLSDSDDHALPMTAQLDRDLGPARGGAIWFFADRNNRLTKGGPAMAQFMAKGHDLFACLSGTIRVEQDPAVIDRFWSPAVAAWYEGGRSDPDLLMLRMDLVDLEAWEVDIGIRGLLKMVTGTRIKGREAGVHIHEAV